jgi:alkylation response protein AidB-like acyl-CoA dehydrogenase
MGRMGQMGRMVFEAEHEEFRSSVRALLQRELVPRLEATRDVGMISRDMWLALGAHGFLGFMVPQEYGGGGIDDFRFNAVLGEELAVHGLAYASSFGINTDVIAPYLLELTTDSQKDRWLRPFAAGELITAIGMSEPEAGSDLGGIRTTARRVGDHWILNGSKTFITNGYRADLVIVAARTPDLGDRAITLFGVESGTPGFSRGKKLDKVGQPEADTAELFFDDVQLSDDAVIGEVGRGFHAMMARLPTERLSIAIACVAHAAAMLGETIAYAKERRAFGQPIGSFQHNRFVLADLATAVEVARCFVDSCLLAKTNGELSPVAAAQAKYVAAETQSRVLDACVQLHGGYGYMRESNVARGWLDARVTRIWGGTSEIMCEVISRSLGL